MITELIKVGGRYLYPVNWLAFFSVLLLWLLFLLVSEKDCWSASEHSNWINWYNWHMGTTRRRPSSVWLFVSSMLSCQMIYVCMGVIVLVLCFTCSVWRLLVMFQWSQLRCQRKSWIHPPQGMNFHDIAWHLYLKIMLVN